MRPPALPERSMLVADIITIIIEQAEQRQIARSGDKAALMAEVRLIVGELPIAMEILKDEIFSLANRAMTKVNCNRQHPIAGDLRLLRWTKVGVGKLPDPNRHERPPATSNRQHSTPNFDHMTPKHTHSHQGVIWHGSAYWKAYVIFMTALFSLSKLRPASVAFFVRQLTAT